MKNCLIKLPDNCYECMCFSAIEGSIADYAGIQPKSCVLLNVMPHIVGIALERPDYCPLERGIINFKNDKTD